MTTAGIILIIVAVIVIAVLVWYYLMVERRSRRLKSRFGPEYDTVVGRYGNRHNAENALIARQKRVARFHVRPLDQDEHDVFLDEWHQVQARFVDSPVDSIHDADVLVSGVMRARGYPTADFERLTEDISVDHPRVVKDYRTAHEIALAHEKGRASTEDLRLAMIYYRELFDEMVEAYTTGSGRTA